MIMALLAVACGDKSTNGGNPPGSDRTSGDSGNSVTSGSQASPASTLEGDSPPASEASPSGSGDGVGVSQVVKGRVIGANPTYWDVSNQGELTTQLTYKLHVGLSTDPLNSEEVWWRYEVTDPDGFRQGFGEQELFDGISKGNGSPGINGALASVYTRTYFLPGPGHYAVSGTFDDEEFSLDIEVNVPPNRIGARAPQGTWERTEIPRSEIAGLLDLAGLWAGRMPEVSTPCQHHNLSWLNFEIDAAYLEQIQRDPRQPAADHDSWLRIHYTGTLGYADPYYSENSVEQVCFLKQHRYEIDAWLQLNPVTDSYTFDIKGWSGGVNTEIDADIAITPVQVEGIGTGQNTGLIQTNQIHEPINGPVDELGIMIEWPKFPDVDFPDGCRPRFLSLRPSPSRATVRGFAAYRESELVGGPITGRAVASAGSGTTVTKGRAELRLSGSEGGEPDFVTAVGEDGHFEFADVTSFVRVDGGLERAFYTLTVRDAPGPGKIEIHGSPEVFFAPGIVEDVIGLSDHEVRLQAVAQPGIKARLIESLSEISPERYALIEQDARLFLAKAELAPHPPM